MGLHAPNKRYAARLPSSLRNRGEMALAREVIENRLIAIFVIRTLEAFEY
jgi:hypothetical protein